jgi:condensin complex subunit 1
VFGPFLFQFHNLILAAVMPMLETIQDEAGSSVQNTKTEQMGVLALCKFMCLSERYCAKHITLLFHLLSSSNSDSNIKNNIMVALGDLLHRWPNTVT